MQGRLSIEQHHISINQVPLDDVPNAQIPRNLGPVGELEPGLVVILLEDDVIGARPLILACMS